MLAIPQTASHCQHAVTHLEQVICQLGSLVGRKPAGGVCNDSQQQWPLPIGTLARPLLLHAFPACLPSKPHTKHVKTGSLAWHCWAQGLMALAMWSCRWWLGLWWTAGCLAQGLAASVMQSCRRWLGLGGMPRTGLGMLQCMSRTGYQGTGYQLHRSQARKVARDSLSRTSEGFVVYHPLLVTVRRRPKRASTIRWARLFVPYCLNPHVVIINRHPFTGHVPAGTARRVRWHLAPRPRPGAATPPGPRPAPACPRSRPAHLHPAWYKLHVR